VTGGYAGAIRSLRHRWRTGWRTRAAPRASLAALARVLLITFLIPPRLRVTGQEPTAGGSIKVQAPSVVVDVIVTDSKGRHVSGLKADDFRVYENDAPQKIVTFVPPVEPAKTAPPGAQPGPPSLAADATQAQETQTRAQGARQASAGAQSPGELAAKAVAPPAGATRAGAKQARAVPTEAEKLANVRFITIVFDIGDIQAGNLRRASDAAEKYLRTQVAPDDFVALYRVDSSLHLLQPFTQDKDQAVRAVRKLSEHVPAGRHTKQQWEDTQERINSILNAMSKPAGSGAQAADRMFRERELGTLLKFQWSQSTIQARAVFVAMRAIAQSYADIPGRKNVVVFSEGFLHSPNARPALQAAIDAANRANVAFYIIDSSGLSTDYTASSGSSPRTVNDDALLVAVSGPEIVPGLDKFDFAEHMGQDIQYDDLGMLASATGGLLMKRQNDLLAGLSRVDDDLREVYTLVYQPTNTNYDGTFRHIKVQLVKPGYHLRFRLGYWAIPPGEEMLMSPAAAQLLAGVASGELKSSFAPELNGTVLLAPDGKLAGPVRVTLPAKEVKFEKDPNQDLYHGGVAFLLLARDAAGRIASVQQRFLDLKFDSHQLGDFQKGALGIDARMAIPKLEPLTFQVILQFVNGKVAIGEKRVPLEPSSAAEPELTGLLLTNRAQAARGPADPADPLRGAGFQLEVPARAQFRSGDKVTAYLGALRLPLDPASHRPRLKLSFSIQQGDTVVTTLEPEEAVGGPGENALLVFKQVDLSGLRPGKYEFRATAENSSGQAVTSRDADFTITPEAAAGTASRASEAFVVGPGEADETSSGAAQNPGQLPPNATPASASILSVPSQELVKAVHDLKGIELAEGQNELPLILKKVGDNVEAFLRNFPNTASIEEIRQQTLDSYNESSGHKFHYLALAEEKTPAGLQEFRQDSNGHQVDAQKKMGGVVTLGFVSMPLVFYPGYQAGADFRLLGRQPLDRREAYAIGFAQRSDTSELYGLMKLSGRPTAFLMQGVAWVDSVAYQILRMKAWLLPAGATRMSVADVTTEVDFAEVQFKQNPLPFWLPRDVEVTVVWRGQRYTNRHHYSDYRLFSVQTQERQVEKAPEN